MSEVVVARTLPDAIERLAADPGLRPIAGGVGVMLDRALGADIDGRWLSISRVPQLHERGRDAAARSIVIGAATTIETVAEPDPASIVPDLLRAAASSVANPGIRAVATIGGNVARGRGRSDIATALVALAARVRLAGPAGERDVDLDALADDPATGELIRHLAISEGAALAPWGWQRLTLRGAMDRSSGSIAVTLAPDAARVVVGCVADRPFRLRTVEALLDASRAASVGPALDEVEAAAAEDLRNVPLADDDRATAAYRLAVLPRLVRRAYAQASRAQEATGAR